MRFEKLKETLSRDEENTKNFLKRKILKCLRSRRWEYSVEGLDSMFILGNKEITTAGMQAKDLVFLLEEIWRW